MNSLCHLTFQNKTQIILIMIWKKYYHNTTKLEDRLKSWGKSTLVVSLIIIIIIIPNHGRFTLVPSGRCYRSLRFCTRTLKKSFSPEAVTTELHTHSAQHYCTHYCTVSVLLYLHCSFLHRLNLSPFSDNYYFCIIHSTNCTFFDYTVHAVLTYTLPFPTLSISPLCTV